MFDRSRTLLQSETVASKRGNDKSYYMFGVDVGRNGDQTVITVIKVNPQRQGVGIKSVVNVITFNSTHFKIQANEIKRQYENYKPRHIAIDGNGLGVGLIDYLVLPSTDDSTGEEFPAFGVFNDEKKQYKKLDTGDAEVIKNVLWIIKANSDINAEGYSNIVSQLGSGKLKFLINERDAKSALLDTDVGRKLSMEERNDRLRPFVLTTMLKAELMNMTKTQTDSVQFKLDRINKKIPKDKVSSLMYCLYAIKQIEDKEKQRKRGSLADMVMIN